MTCLDVLENRQFFTDCKFMPGDGYLKYYLYNWRCKDVPCDKQGFLII